VLDQDFFGEALADAESGVADLADNAGLAAEELDFLLFAEAHFAEAMSHFSRDGKLLNAHVRARPHAAERTQERLGTRLPGLVIGALRIVHPLTVCQPAMAGKILNSEF
jgi:hypothetical protein